MILFIYIIYISLQYVYGSHIYMTFIYIWISYIYEFYIYTNFIYIWILYIYGFHIYIWLLYIWHLWVFIIYIYQCPAWNNKSMMSSIRPFAYFFTESLYDWSVNEPVSSFTTLDNDTDVYQCILIPHSHALHVTVHTKPIYQCQPTCRLSLLCYLSIDM